MAIAPGYLAGALLAVGAGAIYNLGVLVQKRAANAVHAARPKLRAATLMRSLFASRSWLAGMALQFAVGTPMYIAAQFLIGPTLVPGLMATGLIVLALGSPLVAGEPIRRVDLIGVGIVVAAVLLFGLSRLSVDIGGLELFSGEIPIRLIAMTGIVTALSATLLAASRPLEAWKGPLLAVAAGLIYALANLWLGVLAACFTRIAGGARGAELIAGFAVSSVVVMVANVLSFVWTQKAFGHGRAASLIPLQQAPMQIVPAACYFLVFLQTPPTRASPYLSAAAVALILVGSALLGSRRNASL